MTKQPTSFRPIKAGDKVIVPGRYRGLTVSNVEHGQITATFKYGGFYIGKEWEFEATGDTPIWRGDDLVDPKTGKSWAESEYWNKQGRI